MGLVGHLLGAQPHKIDVKDSAKVHGSLRTHPQQLQQRLNLGVALGMRARVEVPHGARLSDPAVRDPAEVNGLGRDAGCDTWQLWCNICALQHKL